MLDPIFKFFSSLRLTVVLLGLSLILVFIGTMAQEPLGLYMAQDRFFRTLFVDAASFWAGVKKMFQMVRIYLPPSSVAEVANAPHIPVFPGGWLLGTLLLINLLAAHAKRFQFSWKKSGIFLTHFGLILLLVGQFFTEILQVESTMTVREGETKNYTDASRQNEFVVIDKSFNSESNRVVAFPESFVSKPGELRHEALPFTIRIKEYLENSRLTGPMATNSQALKATDGTGKRIGFAATEITADMNSENRPAALIEVVAKDSVIGQWVVSTWMTRYAVEHLEQNLSKALAQQLVEPQTFEFEGRNYEIALRPKRFYKPYYIKLLDFSHDKYPGTEKPMNFSSKITLTNPSRSEERDILIYMNNPLRYEGDTFFQSGFLPANNGTILQVVRNPAAITPYVSCVLVAIGMIVQFLMHLVNFGRRQKKTEATPRQSGPTTPHEAAATERKVS